MVEAFWSGYFSIEYKDVAGVLAAGPGPDLPAHRPARQARDRESLEPWPGGSERYRRRHEFGSTGRRFRQSALAAFVALVLFLPLVGMQTV